MVLDQQHMWTACCIATTQLKRFSYNHRFWSLMFNLHIFIMSKCWSTNVPFIAHSLTRMLSCQYTDYALVQDKRLNTEWRRHVGVYRTLHSNFNTTKTISTHCVPPGPHCSTITCLSLAMSISHFDALQDYSGPRWKVPFEEGSDSNMKTWFQVCAQFLQGSMSESNVNISGFGGVGSGDGKNEFFLFFTPQWINKTPCLSRVQTLNYYIIKAPKQRFRCLGISSLLRWCRH